MIGISGSVAARRIRRGVVGKTTGCFCGAGAAVSFITPQYGNSGAERSPSRGVTRDHHLPGMKIGEITGLVACSLARPLSPRHREEQRDEAIHLTLRVACGA